MPEKRAMFRKKYSLDDDEIAIGIIGRLVPIKNHNLFLKSIRYVKDNSSKKIRAFIIGDGEERKNIELEAKKLKIDFTDLENKKATLIFTSWIKDIDIAFSGMDIVALTSSNEGTPVSLIEAQAAGKPIVTTRIGGVGDITISNKTALWCENGNPEDYFNKLLSLIEKKDLRDALSIEGPKHVESVFHYEKLVKNMDELYKTFFSPR